MVQALPTPVTFDQFIDWYPATGKRYELHNGVIIEMNQPAGKHELITLLLSRRLTVEITNKNLPWGVSKNTFVKPPTTDTGYCPDILILNLDNLPHEPSWEKESTVTQSASVPFIAEVVSSNWGVDYGNKVEDYESIGIPEYWVMDYLGIGGKRYIGYPKLPTLSIYSLVDREYQVTQFRGDDLIVSPTFPELNLTAKEVLLTN